MANEPIQLDVIAVGAHPDDVEIGCGGILAKLVKQGYKVGLVDLTDGEPTPLSPGPEVRLAEAQAAGQKLGLQYRKTLDLPNRKLFDTYEARCKLATIFRRHRPRIVLSLFEKTPMASPDHFQAVQITDAAVFYSRLTKWDGDFEGTEPHTIAAQYYYYLGYRKLDLGPYPHFVVDVSDVYEQKFEAVRCYATQFPPAKVNVFERLRAFNRMHGLSAGFQYGEILFTHQAIGVRDLVEYAFGGKQIT